MTQVEALPITALIPESATSPIILYDPQAALRMALVERDCVSSLDDSWDASGVYVLLFPAAVAGRELLDAETGKLKVYVGDAAQGLRNRVSQHVSGKEDWVRALLICRDTTYGFNSAQVGWLEGRLWSLTFASAACSPTNKNRPKDETLPDYDRAVLETCIVPVRRVMRFLGYSLEPPGEAVPSKASSKTRFGVSVADLIKVGLLSAGQSLVFTYPAHPASATLQADGRLLVDGVTYETLSAAAGAIRNGPTNGWAYWATADEHGNNVPLADLRARLLAKSKAR